MKKLSKVIVLIITLTLIACVSTSVWADNDPIDLSNSLTGGNSTTNNETTENNTTDNNTTNNNTTNNTTNNATNNTTGEGTTNNTVQDLTPSTPNTNSTNNTSTYEESNIPHAGVEGTLLMGTAFVVFAVIGIYTFMKLSEYSNI